MRLCKIALGCFFSGASVTVVAVGVKRFFAFSAKNVTEKKQQKDSEGNSKQRQREFVKRLDLFAVGTLAIV